MAVSAAGQGFVDLLFMAGDLWMAHRAISRRKSIPVADFETKEKRQPIATSHRTKTQAKTDEYRVCGNFNPFPQLPFFLTGLTFIRHSARHSWMIMSYIDRRRAAG